MSRRKQSAEDRARRLAEGCCPIHGLGMGQIDRWYTERLGEHRYYTVVGCPRSDCEVRAKAFSPDGPWELPLEWAHLIEGETPSR